MSEKKFKLGERVVVNSRGIKGFAGSGWCGSEGVVTQEVNRCGRVKVRLDNVPRPLKPCQKAYGGLWCHPNHMKSVEEPFKVGDRVFVPRESVYYVNDGWNGSYGTVNRVINNRIPMVRVFLEDVPDGLADIHKEQNGLWCDAPRVKPAEKQTHKKNEVPSQCEIHLSFVGNATTMSLVDADGNVECSATARCHPNDEFDVSTGMKIAFERLYERYRKQNPEHSALMIGDKVRLKKGATLPLITRYGNSDNPSEIILNEAGVVKALSLNSKNATVGWRENVVAVAETSNLEIERDKKVTPKFREGDILVTRKNGRYVRVTKDFYEWEEKVPFETACNVCGEMTPDEFVGKLDDQQKVAVGDIVEAQEEGVRFRGMVVKAGARKNCPWTRDVLVKGIASGNTPMQKLIREDMVKPLYEREPFFGETVFALNAGVVRDYGLKWYDDETIENEGKFCVVVGWNTDSKTGKRTATVEHTNGIAKVDREYMLLLDC